MSDSLKPGATSSGITFPGTIALANERGYFPGVKAILFKSVDEYNTYFSSGNPGDRCLVVDIDRDGASEEIFVHYTRQLTPEEEVDFNDASQALEGKLEEGRKQRKKEREEEEAKQLAAVEEEHRLAKVGRAYEAKLEKAKGLPGNLRGKAIAALQSGQVDVLAPALPIEDVPPEGGTP